MKRIATVGGLLVGATALTVAASGGGDAPSRPKITGIAAVQIRTTVFDKSVEFYSSLVGKSLPTAEPNTSTEDAEHQATFSLPSGQTLRVGSFAAPGPYPMVNDVAFFTDDASALLRYLQSQGVEAQTFGKGSMAGVRVQDPEGHRLTFFRRSPDAKRQSEINAAGEQLPILHVGFVVANREKMDHFYKEILGFRLYWQGGMNDERVDWVSMQVPNGTDWIEYMLNVPENANKHLRGVMNHIALGAADVRAAAERWKKNGGTLVEAPKIGRDGKWQLNLYDPDETRVELMGFTPVEKPCCAEFTGPHPKP
jgi:catechol 2,3-dioxygenase-like lactoylglutathione lyase family enzyme